MQTKTQETEREKLQRIGRAAYEAIADMVAPLNMTEDDLPEDSGQDIEDLRQEAAERIQEDPLSIEVGGWWAPGTSPEPTEYRILLSTGGPATRIVGTLGSYNQPDTATLQAQDWFTSWTDVELTSEESDVLLTYAQQFYFGEEG